MLAWETSPAEAIPKSTIFTMPLSTTKTLCGLMSRW